MQVIITSYDVMMTCIRSLLMLIAGAAFGAPILWSRLPAAVLVLAVIALSYLPFALLATSMRIAFRTSGPLLSVITLVSTVLGGVYYPPAVMPKAIPLWVRAMADYVPLTSGLRAFRRVLLEGTGPLEVLRELGPLLVFAPIAIAVGVLLVKHSLDYARRAGTLSQA
jgi:ABC-2 type transport system permease protein